MLRFVILEHDHPPLHWDFMLQVGGVLRTWRLSAPPCVGEAIAAEVIGDHRLAYLDYEGPVSGGRGTVRAWDRGTYVSREAESQRRVAVELEGERVRGVATLTLSEERWTFVLGGAVSEERTLRET